MDELKDRLKLALTTLNIKSSEFAKATGFSASYVSTLLNPESNKPASPSPRFYRAAQREYNLNPVWLEKGEEEMFCSEGNGLSSAQHQLLKKYYALSEESQMLIESIIDKFLKADQKENKTRQE